MVEVMWWFGDALVEAKQGIDLIKIDGILQKEQYLKILQEHAVPNEKNLISENFVFMPDNDFKHSAKICKNYLKQLEDSMMLKTMQRPPQSNWNIIKLI